ncbi:ABC transporter family substrate-binding protein, partial [Amycolatopsis sp. H6(2020)]|nr:ABC transporter family substrate-binding protein [Amycolatopsis sp. H6(2020)]
MRFSRISKALGVAAVSALALSACASTDNGSGDGDSGSTKSISVAELNTFSSLNTGSSSGNTDINNKIATATHNGFYSITDQLEVKHNDDFGSFEKVSDDPLKVKYTVNEDEQWSDGNKIDKADLLLAWASQSGHFNGEGENGEQFFDYAGDSEGLGLTDMPEFSDDGRTMTLTYSKPYIDWETAFDVGLPAHVVAKKAGISEDDLVNTLTSAKPGEK